MHRQYFEMELIAISKSSAENIEFINNPLCQDTIYLTLDFYKKIGFKPPWICYYAKQNDNLVGSAGFKGPPMNGTVEIAYGTFEKYRNQGIGAEICKKLVDLSLKTNPSIRITARTLPEKNFSTRILEKNNFEFVGIVNDPEDGDVWEWEFTISKYTVDKK
ncbi:MAG TPA: GNAT family protein [Saprospiraceae bacterium]|nr:GNAT family protein [Saprospiraceae bacterium]